MSNLRVRSETWRLVSIFTEPISSGERELSGHFWESDRSEKNQFNVLTLIVGDKKLNGSFRDNAKSLTPGVDPHYEPDLWTTLRTGPWTTPTDPLNGPPPWRDSCDSEIRSRVWVLISGELCYEIEKISHRHVFCGNRLVTHPTARVWEEDQTGDGHAIRVVLNDLWQR